LLAGRIGQSRVDCFGRAALPALDQMAGRDAAIADRRDTFAALDLAGHRHMAILVGFGGQRGRNEAPVPSERCALLFSGLLVNVNLIEIPIAE
jgi:hypothetical protein